MEGIQIYFFIFTPQSHPGDRIRSEERAGAAAGAVRPAERAVTDMRYGEKSDIHRRR